MTAALLPAVDWTATPPAQWQALAEAHGTPLYLLDADVVAQRVQAVREAFGGLAQVYYAVKANPNLGLLQALAGVVDGLDISSGGELAQARLAGHDPAAMSFAGPGKTDEELQDAIAAGVGGISCESLRELDRCAALARRLDRPARVLLRVNPIAPNRGYGVKMGGRPVQFGIDEAALDEAVARLQAHGPALQFQGLHAYVGSQCFDAAVVAETTRDTLRIAGQLADRHGLVSRLLNLGGGFGLGQSAERKLLDLAAAGAMLQPDFQAWRQRFPMGTLLFELGRYLTAEAGVYVTRVVDTKASRGKAYVVCDGGLNHQLAAAGTFGAALRGNFPLFNLSRPEAEPTACQVAGPSCNPTDLLGVDATLPTPQPGDLIGVGHSGAYGLTASPLLFLGHDTPVELVRRHGEVSVGRRRHSVLDFN